MSNKIVFPLSKEYDSKNELEPKRAQNSVESDPNYERKRKEDDAKLREAWEHSLGQSGASGWDKNHHRIGLPSYNKLLEIFKRHVQEAQLNYPVEFYPV